MNVLPVPVASVTSAFFCPRPNALMIPSTARSW